MIETMRERIIIQKSKTGKDKNGNHTLIWEDYYSCYAYVNNLSGNEYWAAAQVNAQSDQYFIVRYCSEIKNMDSEHYRIIFRDQIYNISFVDNVQYQKDKLISLFSLRVYMFSVSKKTPIGGFIAFNCRTWPIQSRTFLANLDTLLVTIKSIFPA